VSAIISKENLLISGKLLRYGSTREPPAKISSVEMLAPIFSNIGTSNLSGRAVILGIDAILGPFSNSTLAASSGGNGASSKFRSKVVSSGSWKTGALSPSDRGSVITPFKADAAAVSGLHKNTLSSCVPDLPGKFLGVVRKLFRPVAGACPIPIQPLQPAWCILPPACNKLAI